MAKRLAHFAPGPVHLQAAIWEMKSVSEKPRFALLVHGSEKETCMPIADARAVKS